MELATRTPHVANLAVGVIVAYALYLLASRISLARKRRQIIRERGCLPATALPQRERILGYSLFRTNLKNLKQHRLLESGQQRFASMGLNTFTQVTMGRRTIATIEPENLKAIQATDAKNWGLGKRRKIAFRPLLGVGIFTSDGQDWQHSREMLRPNFVRSQVGDLETFESHIKDLIKTIPKDGTTVNLSELFFRLTMDSATEFLFGESTNTLSTSSHEGFAGAFGRGQDYISSMSRLGFVGDFWPETNEFKQDRQLVHEVVDQYAKKALARRHELSKGREAGTSGRYVFVEELVRQTDDLVRIRSELLNILLAGRDTTASLLTNVWFMLSKRPEMWAKLQAEVATLDGAKPTFEELKNLKYLKAILNESLRLHPVVPGNSREATADTVLPLGGGPDGSAPLFVEKGTLCFFSPYTMHRRKDFYGEDAEEFKPERWLDDPTTGRKGLRPGWEYLPFNGGPRICLGQQFALTEASYTTVRLCQTFAGIESRDPGPWIEHLALTCVNLNGAKVALTQREQ